MCSSSLPCSGRRSINRHGDEVVEGISERVRQALCQVGSAAAAGYLTESTSG